MTKIDPTPLIAEAQARETALKVALDKIDALDDQVRAWRGCAAVLFSVVCVLVVVLA